MTADYIAYAEEHIPRILNGGKTVTARYQFERDISEGDVVDLTTADGEVFTRARILLDTTMTVESFGRFDFAGHRSYDSVEEFCDELRQYYDAPRDGFGPETMLRVFGFEVVEDDA